MIVEQYINTILQTAVKPYYITAFHATTFYGLSADCKLKEIEPMAVELATKVKHHAKDTDYSKIIIIYINKITKKSYIGNLDYVLTSNKNVNK